MCWQEKGEQIPLTSSRKVSPFCPVSGIEEEVGVKSQMLPYGRSLEQGLMNGTKLLRHALLLAGALLGGAGDPPDHCQPLEECREDRDSCPVSLANGLSSHRQVTLSRSKLSSCLSVLCSHLLASHRWVEVTLFEYRLGLSLGLNCKLEFMQGELDGCKYQAQPLVEI